LITDYVNNHEREYKPEIAKTSITKNSNLRDLRLSQRQVGKKLQTITLPSQLQEDKYNKR